MNETQAYDQLRIVLLSAATPGREARIDALLGAIDSHAGPLAPTNIAVDGDPAYAAPAVRKILAADLKSKRGRVMAQSVILYRPEPNIRMTISTLLPGESVDLEAELGVPLTWFAADGTARADLVVTLVAAMAEAMGASFGFAHGRTDLSVGRDEHYTDPYAPIKIVESHWVDVLGPELVEQLGRARVMSTPAEVLPLKGGGVLVRSRATPVDYNSAEARAAQVGVLAHLTDKPPNAIAARLAERSARLAPVEPAFDPDVAALLERIVRTRDWGDQAQAIAQWNAFHAPDPDEWMPSDLALGRNVPDVEAEIDRYSLHAEQLVALVHEDVPEVGNADPKVLPAVDFHFWNFNYPRRFPQSRVDDKLVPALGAWLGELLVNTLGGRWIPRKNLDESEVVVGKRAWLPFLRARRMLADRDSVAKFSLNQLYRVAERHR